MMVVDEAQLIPFRRFLDLYIETYMNPLRPPSLSDEWLVKQKAAELRLAWRPLNGNDKAA